MPRSFKDYTGQFFWNFKRMDNVNYNFRILEILYSARKQNKNNALLIKPIIIIIISIMECMLYDFIERIQGHTADRIPNLAESIISYIRGKKIDDFEKIIRQIEKQNLLRASISDTIYSDLDLLRKIRNRVHIQDKEHQLDKDDYSVFNEENLHLAERTFERLCEILCNTYPRWNKQPLPMSDFPRPWPRYPF
jgi:hypothetical protein